LHCPKVTKMKKFVIMFGEGIDSRAIRTIPEEYRKQILLKRVFLFPEKGHPRNHVRIIEQLCIDFNKSSESYVILTHSPYFVDHLTNLMIAYNSGKDVSDLFLLKSSKAFMNPDEVEAFLHENGVTTNVFNRKECQIDWQTFSTVSEELCDIYFEIQDRAKKN
jgi:hypothetical protein